MRFFRLCIRGSLCGSLRARYGATGSGRHFSPRIGTSWWHSPCYRERNVSHRSKESMPFAYTRRTTIDAGLSCRIFPATGRSLKASSGEPVQFPRNMYTRLVIHCRRRWHSTASYCSAIPLKSTGTGCTNVFTITPPSHRSRHFCAHDATMCQHRDRNALHCIATAKAINRMFDYAA